MKSGEIIRIIGSFFLGIILMLWVWPLIYQSRIIRVADFPGGVTEWLSENYQIGAWIVLVASMIATVIWSVMTATAKIKGSVDISQWRVVWWLLGLIPLISICIAIYFFNDSNDALLSLVGFFLFTGLILLYWLPTAISSPGLFKHLPPGSFTLRRLIG